MTEPEVWVPVPPEWDVPPSAYESRYRNVMVADTLATEKMAAEALAVAPAYSATPLTFFPDVSQFNGRPVDASLQTSMFSFRVCDGTYFDTMAETNWAVASSLLTDNSHPLEVVWAYFFFRPGTWPTVNSYINRVFGEGPLPNRVVAMIDCEGWGGEVTGNHSPELNQWAANLAARTTSGWPSVAGYSYTAGFNELWPQKDPRIKRHTASYGNWDPGWYGWQYSGGTGTGGMSGWPHGAGPWPLCDMNVIRRDIRTIISDFGFTQEDDVTPQDITAIKDAVWSQMIGGYSAASLLNVIHGDTTDTRSDVNTIILDPNHGYSLQGIKAAVDAVAAQIAALPSGPGGTLSKQDVIDILNKTGLHVDAP